LIIATSISLLQNEDKIEHFIINKPEQGIVHNEKNLLISPAFTTDYKYIYNGDKVYSHVV
jgi:hypothetical protein